MKHKNKSVHNKVKSLDIYDFTGPLWEKYFKKTQQTVRYPRGYKEVSMIR